MRQSDIGPEGYIPRVVDQSIQDALRSSPAVVLEGPRACGKTWTGRSFANSMVRFDELEATRLSLEVNPASFLTGNTPRLLDEWHLADGLWNAMRHACDDRNLNGQFILAGSIKPTYSATDHSGAGRVARIQMRPMSLVESDDSSGSISLSALLEGSECASDAPDIDLQQIASLICRGGFPRFVTASPTDAQARMVDYLKDIALLDLSGNGKADHDPEKMTALIRSLARNETTSASHQTLANDIGNSGGPADRATITRYLERLSQAFVLEHLRGWNTHLRSKTTLRSTPKRYFTDPSLAAAALNATPEALLNDLPTLGLLFESLAIRDLRVYIQALRADLRYYRDSKNLECDAIITGGIKQRHGQWAAVEIKLGGANAIASGIASLRKVRDKVDTQKAGNPSRLIVLTAVGHAFETTDNIAVVPITLLGP
ncbi:MAG: DUF4143 domain-containing protein [bacterium]|nr:DUF4143 domain-containing protein [bacterium]